VRQLHILTKQYEPIFTRLAIVKVSLDHLLFMLLDLAEATLHSDAKT